MRLRTLTVLSLSLVPALAAAHEEDYPKEKPRTRAPTYDPAEFRSDQNFALEFRFGPYRPNVDDEFGGGATPFLDTFGLGESVSFGLEFDWQALRIPHFGTIGPGVSWGMVSYQGNARFVSDNSVSAQSTGLWIMPMFAVAVLRVDVFAREFSVPLVPYGKVGGHFGLWEASDAGNVSVADGMNGRGLSTGLQHQLGLMLHLNAIAPQASLDMDNTTGINHAYLFGEWWNVVPIGSGLNTGTSSWNVGLAFEF